MRRHRQSRHGEGTAWLVADGTATGFHCYWYGGRAGDRLVEQAHVASASEAVAWGRDRTPRVRIHTAEGRTYWAGTAPRPEGLAHSWSGHDAVPVAAGSSEHEREASPASDAGDPVQAAPVPAPVPALVGAGRLPGGQSC